MTVLKLAAKPWRKDFVLVQASTLAAGLGHTPKGLKPAAKKALERLTQKALPKEPEDVDVEAVYAMMVDLRRGKVADCEELASFWARRSAAFAVDVAARTCGLAVDTFDDAVAVIEERLSPFMAKAHFAAMNGNQLPVEAWRGVRHVLRTADEASYDAAKKAATAHRKKLAPYHRAMVSYAFPKEKSWAAEDAAEALKLAPVPKWSAPLFATRLEPKTAKRLADAWPDEHYVVPFFDDLVEVHGAASRAILGAFVAKKSRVVADRRALEAVLERA